MAKLNPVHLKQAQDLDDQRGRKLKHELPPGLRLKLLGLGIPDEDHGVTIRAMATLGDEHAKHLDCGYLHGLLGGLMCQQGHPFKGDGEEFTGEQVQRIWRDVTDQPDPEPDGGDDA